MVVLLLSSLFLFPATDRCADDDSSSGRLDVSKLKKTKDKRHQKKTKQN